MDGLIVVFVYEKGDEVKVLDYDDANAMHTNLIVAGWEHTPTLDAIHYIKRILTEKKNEGKLPS